MSTNTPAQPIGPDMVVSPQAQPKVTMEQEPSPSISAHIHQPEASSSSTNISWPFTSALSENENYPDRLQMDQHYLKAYECQVNGCTKCFATLEGLIRHGSSAHEYQIEAKKSTPIVISNPIHNPFADQEYQIQVHNEQTTGPTPLHERIEPIELTEEDLLDHFSSLFMNQQQPNPTIRNEQAVGPVQIQQQNIHPIENRNNNSAIQQNLNEEVHTELIPAPAPLHERIEPIELTGADLLDHFSSLFMNRQYPNAIQPTNQQPNNNFIQAVRSEQSNVQVQPKSIHRPTNTTKSSFKCDICGETFTSNTKFKRHLRSHNWKLQCRPSKYRDPYVSKRLPQNVIETMRFAQLGDKQLAAIKVKPSNEQQQSNVEPIRVVHLASMNQPAVDLETTHQPNQSHQYPSSQSKRIDLSASNNPNLVGPVHDDQQASGSAVMQPSLESNSKTHLPTTSTNKKSYPCDVCARPFTHMGNLKKHISTHSNERLFKCAKCPLTFKHEYNLKAHLKTHSTAKPFRCAVCEITFTVKYYLQAHIKTQKHQLNQKAKESDAASGQS